MISSPEHKKCHAKDDSLEPPRVPINWERAPHNTTQNYCKTIFCLNTQHVSARHGRYHALYKQNCRDLNKSNVLQLIYFVFDGFLTQPILEQDR